MTRDEILNMPAGREMDALVWMALHEQSPDLTLCRFVDGDYQPNAGYPVGHISPPNYSTDIAAAWEVKEKIGFPISLVESMLGGDFSCEFLVDLETSEIVEGIAGTAPLAICRASLLAAMSAMNL